MSDQYAVYGTFCPWSLLMVYSLHKSSIETFFSGQFANAVQFVIEEVFLKKHNFKPLLVVGSEGSWGILLMVSLVLPVLYYIPGT